jgi:competence ComEA-like helix-hairpin-helix protein
VSAFGAVAIARYESHSHPQLPTKQLAAPAPAPPGAQLRALRDGRPIDVNRASAAELELLPGVGPSLARRLVEARERAGGFRRAADLRAVRGIGAKTLEKLAPFLTFSSEQFEHPADSELSLGERAGLAVDPQEAGAHVDTERPAAGREVVEPEQ